MKALIILFFLFAGSNGFCQKKQDTVPDNTLKFKIKAIDEYVISIDKNKNLKKDGMTGELTNGGIMETNTYTDTVIHEQLKSEGILPDKYVSYLKHNKEVFFRQVIDSTAQIRETYFENDKIIYSRVIQQKILKISYGRFSGGKHGGYDRFEITPDLIKYETGSRYPEDHHVSTRQNSVENWNELIGAIKFREFYNIKNGKSRTPSDGTDYGLTIQTESHFYNIMNYNSHDKHYKKMSGFFEKLSLQTNGHYNELN